jgi:ABC-type uncharacterized transport system ATPase subunit
VCRANTPCGPQEEDLGTQDDDLLGRNSGRLQRSYPDRIGIANEERNIDRCVVVSPRNAVKYGSDLRSVAQKHLSAKTDPFLERRLEVRRQGRGVRVEDHVARRDVRRDVVQAAADEHAPEEIHLQPSIADVDRSKEGNVSHGDTLATGICVRL